jgi:hypothetical protein
VHYDIHLRNLPSKAEAESLAAKMKDRFGLDARPTL